MVNQRSKQGVSIMAILSLTTKALHTKTHTKHTLNKSHPYLSPCIILTAADCKYKWSQWQNPIETLILQDKGCNYKHFNIVILRDCLNIIGKVDHFPFCFNMTNNQKFGTLQISR